MSDSEKDRRDRARGASFTISEWCEHRRISPAMFYKLDSAGRAPLTHRAGSRRLISAEADAAWVRAREAENATNTETAA